MFQRIGLGYINKIPGLLTSLIGGGRTVEAGASDDDVLDDMLTSQVMDDMQDEVMARHVVSITQGINESVESPQHVFTKYAAMHHIPDGDQRIMAAYFRNRNLEVWSASEHEELNNDVVKLAEDLSYIKPVMAAGGYAVYSVPDPYFVLEHQQTGKAWVVDASQSLPAYIGAAYPSVIDAVDNARSITMHMKNASIATAVDPTIYEHNGNIIIGIDNGKFYIVDTDTTPPQFTDITQPSLRQAVQLLDSARDAIREMSVREAQRVQDNFTAGVTRIKVIYRGTTVMGTILGARTQHVATGDNKEYRVQLDRPHNRIVWVRDANVVQVYTDGNTRHSQLSNGESLTNQFSKYGSLTNRTAQAIPGASPMQAPAPAPNGGPAPNAPSVPSGGPGAASPGPVPGPAPAAPEAPDAAPVPGGDRMQGVVSDIGGLNDQIKQTAKSMFMTDLSDEQSTQVLEKVVDIIATSVANNTADAVMTAYSPATAPNSGPGGS